MKSMVPSSKVDMDRPYGGWINHRYLELNGRIRKGIANPRRERLAARIALRKIGLRYKEIIPFFNPLHTGFKENENGTIQWLDFCILMPTKKMAVILFDIKQGGRGQKPYEYRSYNTKRQYLKDRNIPCLIMKRSYTSMEMEIVIRRFLQKEK